jgi:hypothetical protein
VVATPGFLGVAAGNGTVYEFPPSLVLEPNTQYFFYADNRPGGPGGNSLVAASYGGGSYYGSPNGNSSFEEKDHLDAPFSLQGESLFVLDSDLDGMNDLSELRMAALGFDRQISQPTLVSTYFENANGAGLFTEAQLGALSIGTPLIGKDASGQFKLTIGVEKSSNLSTFAPFPMTTPDTSINGAGELEFLFTSPDDTALFRLDSD